MIIKDKDGNILQAKKVINRDSDGKPESWQATFTNQQGTTVEPSEVIGLLVDSNGRVKGDGTSEGSQNMWWWGFCDRNTAQRLYKSKFQIPDLDVDVSR